ISFASLAMVNPPFTVGPAWAGAAPLPGPRPGAPSACGGKFFPRLYHRLYIISSYTNKLYIFALSAPGAAADLLQAGHPVGLHPVPDLPGDAHAGPGVQEVGGAHLDSRRAGHDELQRVPAGEDAP